MLLLAYLAVDYCFTVSLLFLSWCFPNTNLRNGLSLNPWIDGFIAEVGDSAAWRSGSEADTPLSLCWVQWVRPEADFPTGNSKGDVSEAKAPPLRLSFSSFRIPFATTFLCMTCLFKRHLPMARSPFGPFTPVPIATWLWTRCLRCVSWLRLHGARVGRGHIHLKKEPSCPCDELNWSGQS